MSEEIEQLIHSHRGPVIVQLGEPFLEVSQQMEAVIAETEQWGTDIRVVRVVLSLHREWACKYRVYGSPCTLVFQRGKLCLRAHGRFGRSQLRDILERAGLLDGSPPTIPPDS